MAVAVISLGGKQFTVQPGKIIGVPRLAHEPGHSFVVDDILAGKKVSAKVIDHKKGDKLRVIKFKNKTRYTRTIGHRDRLTNVEILTIE